MTYYTLHSQVQKVCGSLWRRPYRGIHSGVECPSLSTLTRRIASRSTSPSDGASASHVPRRPWRFSIELSTPILEKPLVLQSAHANSSGHDHRHFITTTSSVADQMRWDTFVQETVPAVRALRPSFVTLPCKEPYFPEAMTSTSAERPGTTSALSTTQAVVHVLSSMAAVPVMLTVNATIDPRSRHSPMCGTEETSSDVTSSFFAAVRDVIVDFTQRRGGLHVLVVRGDDYSRAARGAATVHASASPSSSHITRTTSGVCQRARATSASLLSFVRATLLDVSVTPSAVSRQQAGLIAVAGYPQGHITQRLWWSSDGDALQADETALATKADGPGAVLTRPSGASTATLAEWEVRYKQVAARGGHPTPDLTTATAATARLVARLDALARRVERGRLVDLFATRPSSYPASTRERNIVHELVADKILPSLASQTRVMVITQVNFSAHTFLSYERDILSAVDAATCDSRSQDRGVVVAAGVLVPPVHDAAIALPNFLNSIVRLKVIPSDALVAAVRSYTEPLASHLTRTRAILTAQSKDAILSDSATQSLLDELNVAVDHLDRTFTACWWQETVALVRTLLTAGDIDTDGSTSQRSSRSAEPAHIHFFPVGAGAAACTNITRLIEDAGGVMP